MPEKRMVLLNPGPVNISDRVRRALLQPDICHREPEFSELLQRIRGQLLQVYDLDPARYVSIVLSGSGTAAVEAALVSLVPPSGKLLVLSNGVYGERIAAIANAYHITYRELVHDWGQPIDLKAVEQTLADRSFTTVAVVHHETTTGLRNELPDLGALVSAHHCELLLDAVSSFGGEAIEFEGWGIGACCATANKCLHSVPGASFVVVRREIMEGSKSFPPRSVYLNLADYFTSQEKGIPPFTPAIPAFYALEEALSELLETGVKVRIGMYAAKAARIRDLGRQVGLRPLMPDDRFSNTLTSFFLPQGLPYQALHDALRELGFVIYAGQGGLKQNIFRIANMGDVTMEEIERLFAGIRTLMASVA